MPANSWITAVKEYYQKKGIPFTIPKKGTDDYNAIKASLPAKPAKEPKAPKEKKVKLESAKTYEGAIIQLRKKIATECDETRKAKLQSKLNMLLAS